MGLSVGASPMASRPTLSTDFVDKYEDCCATWERDAVYTACDKPSGAKLQPLTSKEYQHASLRKIYSTD